MSRRYAIIDTTSVTPSMAAATVDGSVESMRKTVRNTDKCLLRWDGANPPGTLSLTTYTQDEIINIVNDESGDWWIDFESYRGYSE